MKRVSASPAPFRAWRNKFRAPFLDSEFAALAQYSEQVHGDVKNWVFLPFEVLRSVKRKWIEAPNELVETLSSPAFANPRKIPPEMPTEMINAARL